MGRVAWLSVVCARHKSCREHFFKSKPLGLQMLPLKWVLWGARFKNKQNRFFVLKQKKRDPTTKFGLPFLSKKAKWTPTGLFAAHTENGVHTEKNNCCCLLLWKQEARSYERGALYNPPPPIKVCDHAKLNSIKRKNEKEKGTKGQIRLLPSHQWDGQAIVLMPMIRWQWWLPTEQDSQDGNNFFLKLLKHSNNNF